MTPRFSIFTAAIAASLALWGLIVLVLRGCI